MWKPEHRVAADRRGLRYASDLTDAEWALVAPLIRPAKCGGRPRTVNVREVLNAIFYVLWTGCQWKALPKDLPPQHGLGVPGPVAVGRHAHPHPSDRKSTRLNSSHANISYAVFCLKKKTAPPPDPLTPPLS